MATAPQVQTLAVKGEKFPEIHCLLHVAAPAIEARALFTFIGRNGNTVEKIRSLIAVPPAIEAVLRAYAARYPEDGASVEHALEFRRRVGEEFERLVSRAVEGKAEGRPLETRESALSHHNITAPVCA